MAKLPTIIKNMQQGQMKRLAEGGDAEAAFDPSKVLEAPDQKTTLDTTEKLTPTVGSVKTGEEVASPTLSTTPTVDINTANYSTLNVTKPQAVAAAEYTAYTTTGTPEAIAAQGTLSQESKIGNVIGAVSDLSVAEAAQGTVSEQSTVKYQLGKLYESIKTGEELPSWAAPAVRNVSAQMQARGLGASSMAAAAITQAIMEAGIPIAAQDAKTYSQMELVNLNNAQQTALKNAMTYAAMDTANLNVAATVATNNAKAFLAIDSQNLTQSQQANMLTHQSYMQKLTTDQAQINAAKNFNAKSENQSTEFFTELGTQVENANYTRIAAMEQFNADQGNATARFTAQLEDSRDKFNSNMQAQIDQSNVNWRRTINTANTSLVNETNRINAQNTLGLSTNAQNQLWQRYRDEASWVLQRAENASQRAHQYAMTAQQNNFDDDMYRQTFRDSTYSEMGKFALDLLF